MLRLLLLLAPALLAADLARDAAQVIERNCAVCHGAAIKTSGLDLRSRDGMLAGGAHGPALMPGSAEKSRLYRMAAGLDQPSMPPGKKLPAAELDVIRRWIDAGAPGFEGAKATAGPDPKALAALEDRPITPEERKWWAFQPPARREAPPVRDAAWVRNPIDAFLLSALEAKGLTPAPEAPRRLLIRRLYLDVIGLPPEPADVEAFVSDSSAGAYEKLVDKLLASPHYGERWGRHWLDLVRYADSGGFEFDRDRTNAWRYRDYVIRAFNQDKPYDRFIREQLAGDEMPGGSADAVIATGFIRHGPEPNIKTEQTRMDELDDILSVTAQTFLGATIGCARCHNHKFDPIPQKDYYQMQAVFFPAEYANTPLATAEEIARHEAANRAVDEQEKPVKQARSALEEPYRKKLLDEKRAALPEYIQEALRTPPEKRADGQKLSALQVEKTLRATEKEVLAVMTPADLARHGDIGEQIAMLETRRPAPLPTAFAVREPGPDPKPSYFLHHGSPSNKGSLMKPGVLSVASKTDLAVPAPPADARSSYRRTAFAEWIASAENPLTARVMVNRIWQHHFGEGIVPTPNNFGKSGQPPSHPELLDWLATEFVRQGWSLKAMHRLMLTSAAYRMSSPDVPANLKMDPQTRFSWRMPRQRLEGEAIRDSILAVAGTLDRSMGGPGVFPYIDPALWSASSGRNWPGRPDSDPATWRRSVYVFTKRTIPLPMLEAFDKPDSIGSCARRNRSTIAPQALLLMNNAFVERQARFFAQRLERETGADEAARVDRAFELALGRKPSDTERKTSLEFIRGGPYGLVDFCLAMFNLNEFVYAE